MKIEEILKIKKYENLEISQKQIDNIQNLANLQVNIFKEQASSNDAIDLSDEDFYKYAEFMVCDLLNNFIELEEQAKMADEEMSLEQVKERVNLKTVSEMSNRFEYDLFEDNLYAILVELDNEVYDEASECNLSNDAEQYLQNLQITIKEELLNTIKDLKNRNLTI